MSDTQTIELAARWQLATLRAQQWPRVMARRDGAK